MLTPGQRDWLIHAKIKGYETGFDAQPLQSLLALEQMGLIERNPTTRGEYTHWRITEKGTEFSVGES